MMEYVLLAGVLVANSPAFQWLENCNTPQVSCHIYQFQNSKQEVQEIHILVCDRREGFRGGFTYKAVKSNKIFTITIQDGSKCSII